MLESSSSRLERAKYSSFNFLRASESVVEV